MPVEETDETLDPGTTTPEPETVVEPETPEVEAAAPADDAFSRLAQRVTASFSDKGGIPAEEAERVLGALDDEAIRKLPAEAQVALRAVPEIVTREVAAAKAKVDQERAALVAERAKFDAERKALIRQQRELADLVGSDAMRALMAKAAPAAGDEPDLLTPEGQASHIERKVAQGLASVLRPLAETSEATRRLSVWNEFVDDNAVLRDEAARGRFTALVGQIAAERAVKNEKGEVVQKGVVSPTEWPRILAQVQAEQIVQRDKARRDAETQARAAAAAKVSRPTRTTTAAPQLPTDFDKWPARERAAFFQAHPDIYDAVRRQPAA